MVNKTFISLTQPLIKKDYEIFSGDHCMDNELVSLVPVSRRLSAENAMAIICYSVGRKRTLKNSAISETIGIREA